MNKKTRSLWLALFGICTFIGLLSFSIAYSEGAIDGDDTPFYYPLIHEMTGAYAAFLLLPFLLRFFNRFPVTKENWYRTIPVHLMGSVVFGVSHTLLMTGSRVLIFAALSLEEYKMGEPVLRFVMEYQKQILLYVGVMIGQRMVRHYLASREQERRTAELELQAGQYQARLMQARLQALQAQIQPHFLFNTLNMISSTMFEDPARADRMITRLSTLLRMSFENSGNDKIPLKQELDFLELYFEMMKARFEDKFEASILAETETENALIPNLLLQPLVENAIKHHDSNSIKIEIRSRKVLEDLVMEVVDDGPGLGESLPVTSGVGLSNTRDRLQYLYGSSHQFQLRNNPERKGLTVRIQIPWELSAIPRPV